MQFRKSDSEVKDRFQDENIPTEIVYSKIQDRVIRFIKTGDNQKNLVIFIHGAPGSSQDYFHFLEDSLLLENCTMVSIDRPGYGYSEFGRSEKSILRQSEIINELIEKHFNHYSSITILGHSFGGPVAGIMGASDHGNLRHIIMLAPAIDPELELIFWISYLAKWPPFRWLTPTAWRVASDEKFSHEMALQEMLPIWKNIKTKTLHVHGTDDILVPYENIYFSKQNVPASFLEIKTLEGANHFLPWSHEDLVKELILKSLENN